MSMRHALPLIAALGLAAQGTLAAGIVPLTVVNIEPLSFGTFAAGAGGSVAINASGFRSATGGVTLIASGGGTAARFEVSGEPNRRYAISLPANSSVRLASGNGTAMELSHFTSVPSGAGLLNAMGRQTISVGARLEVGTGQPRAIKNSKTNFTLQVDYE